MSSPLFSIGGIASGLPADLVDQLIAVERQPLQRLQLRQDVLSATKDAWAQVTVRLSAVRSAVDALRRANSFTDFWAATSEDTSVATVAVTGTPIEQSVDFTVDALARRQQTTVADGFSSLDDSLGGRTLTITVDGTDHDVTPAVDQTLGGLIESINAADIGVRASTISNGGQLQLVLTSTESGLDNAFSVAPATSGWTNAFSNLTDAADASISIGQTNPLTITSSTNTFANVIPGVSVQVRALGATSVTTQRDTEGIVTAAQTLVDSVNSALTALGDLSSYNAETGRSGPLNGDFTVRQLMTDLRSVISAPVGGLTSQYTAGNQVGIELTRDGLVTLDQAALRDALATDFDAVANLFSRRGASDTAGVRFVDATRDTLAGTFTVDVANPSTAARITGAAVSAIPSDPRIYTVRTTEGDIVTVTIPANASVATAVAEINAAMGGTSISAVVDDAGTPGDDSDDMIQIDHSGLGPQFGFSITADSEDVDGNVLDEYGIRTNGFVYGDAVISVDVDGTPTEFTGTGRTVRITDGDADGLTLSVSGAPGTQAQVTVTEGIAGALDRLIFAAEGSTGSVARAQDLIDTDVKLLQDRIDRMEVSLATRETALRRQYAALESVISQLTSMGNFLNTQFAQLSAFTSRQN